MNNQLVNVGSVIGKEIVDLQNGSIIGRVQLVTIDPEEKKVLGIKIKLKGFLGGKDFISFKNIKFFGSHTVTVSDLKDDEDIDGRNILGMSVITTQGTALGRVADFGFVAETGEIKELVLSGGQAHDRLHGHVLIEHEYIAHIGRDVIIAQENISEKDLKQPEEEIYGTWQEVDKILEQIDQDNEVNSSDDDFDLGLHQDDLKKIVDKTKNNAEKVWHETKTKVTSDEFTNKVKDQAERITDEAKVLFSDLINKLNKADIEQIKNKMATFLKNNKKSEIDEDLPSQIVNQLQGCTITEPLVDAKGNVIIWPGQMIGDEEVKMAIKEGKLQELISLTTHIISSEEEVEHHQEKFNSEVELDVTQDSAQKEEQVDVEVIAPKATK